LGDASSDVRGKARIESFFASDVFFHKTSTRVLLEILSDVQTGISRVNHNVIVNNKTPLSPAASADATTR
jgi:hypothetical protein